VLRAGALGYLAKRSAPEALIAAVLAVARGGRYVDAQTAQALALAQIDGESSPADVLSEREFSVFLQLAQGRSVATIAETLRLSPSTVGTHLYHVKQKLGAGNQSELTLVALRWGLLQA
jgi:two-component system invasion response regulator UvrY